MKEIWKDIEGYEGLYMVSSLGRIRTTKTQKIRKLVHNPKGYLMVKLCKNGVSKGYSVHRIVCETFIPNPYNLPQVNHKDENKENNNVDNLEWCTNEYNHNYGTRNKRVSEKLVGNPKMKTCLGKTGKDHHSSIPIIQFTKDGELMKMWYSAADVNKEIGVNFRNISSCCKGLRKSAGGYKWEYYDTEKYLIALMNKNFRLKRNAS